MRFAFDERKVTAAAALLITLQGGQARYLRLIKLLYLADRESFRRFGRPISGDRYVAMKKGPVLSRVLDLIKDVPCETTGDWAAHIERFGQYSVRVRSDPGRGPLSEAEIEVLTETFNLFRQHDQWHIVEVTHLLPEYRWAWKTQSRITPESILKALDQPEEAIEDARARAFEREYFDRMFGSALSATDRPDVR